VKPEAIALLKRNLKYLSDDDLAQLAIVVFGALRKRGANKRRDLKVNGFWELKDCEPIRTF